MTEFHCNCGEVITGTKRDVATHLRECWTANNPTAPRPPALRERGDLISTHEDGVLIVSKRPEPFRPPAPPAMRVWYKNRHTGTFGFIRISDTGGGFDVIGGTGYVVAIVTEYDLEVHWERIDAPPEPADGDSDGRVSACPHYGAEVPHDFTGCARCLIAQECYDVYVERAREAA